MAPKFFSYSSLDKSTDVWTNVPLTATIDILLVDEAGQTPPEVGVALFGLAQKAVVVGDIKQIEPLWALPQKIDAGTLLRNRLINNYSDQRFNDQYMHRGALVSNGSIMKLAQNACNYTEENVQERGMMLKEHRRCYDQIIDYCNALAYGGQLIPMKGRQSADATFPAMGLVHVEGNSAVFNQERSNKNEAKAIANWLVANKAILEANGKTIENQVGIITPFVRQKKELSNELSKIGLNVNIMKIGTVHALQGAEREIILFSSVYGDGDTKGQMFFDRDNKPNMLNVAVSRAKTSFIVFGNERIFDRKANTPSGILSRYLESMPLY